MLVAPQLLVPSEPVALLGGFDLAVNRPAIESSSSAAFTFFALQEHAISRIYLAGTLWPDVSERRSSETRTALWIMHPADAEVIVATGGHIQFAGNSCSVDVRELVHAPPELRSTAEEFNFVRRFRFADLLLTGTRIRSIVGADAYGDCQFLALDEIVDALEVDATPRRLKRVCSIRFDALRERPTVCCFVLPSPRAIFATRNATIASSWLVCGRSRNQALERDGRAGTTDPPSLTHVDDPLTHR